MTAQLHLQIDDRSGVPVYRQMMDQMKYYVAGGTLRPGDQLPSIRELAGALAVNPTTVVKAYTELEREGVIEMRHGKGAFAAEQELALRRTARQLAMEAAQLNVPGPRVLAVVRSEMNLLEQDRGESPAEPQRFRIVTGGAA